MDIVEKELRWQLRMANKRIMYLRNALSSITFGEQEGDADKYIAADAVIADTKLDNIAYEHREQTNAKARR